MKKIVVFLSLIMVVVLSTITVLATDNVMINVDKTKVNLGEEIIVSIDVDSEETSLYAYTAKLSYDNDVFEMIETEDFQEQENWSDILYNQENNKFALINKKGVNSDKLLQVKLKVKEDAKAGKTNITVDNITASDGNRDIKIKGNSVEVSVQSNGLNEGEGIIDNNANTPEDSSVTIKVERDFPWIAVLLIILIIVIVICLVYYYIEYAQFDSNSKKIIITIASIVIIAILFTMAFRIFTRKDTDINKDSYKDYEDPKDILEYILEIKKPQDEDLKDMDVNNDGKITITDVAITTKEVANQKYNVNVSEGTVSNNQEDSNQNSNVPTQPNYESSIGKTSVSNLTPKKGEDITLDLNIDVTPYTNVKSVIIDGKEYPVEKGEGNNYKVTIPVPEQAGVKDVVITGVVLDNGKEVETEYKVTIDVLKDEPKVGEFSIDTEKEIPEISVNINDNDGAIKSGKVVVTDEEGNIVFESDRLENGNNTYVVDGLEKDKKYNVKVEVEYDLDSNVYGNPEDNSGKETLVNQDFIINANYGFEGRNYTITDKVTSEDKVVITFENAYDSYYDVDYVLIDGKEYKVTKNGNVYQIELEKGTKGKNTVVIDEVVLKNGKNYSVNKELEYTYLKDTPVVGDIEVEFNDDKVNVTFSSEDNDNTIKSVTAYLTDSQGNIVDSKILEDGQTNVEFDVNEAGDYKVKLEVTYDLGDGEEVTKEVEYENVVKAPVKVTILSSSIDNTYVEKGQKVDVTYTIETNVKDNITSIVINGVTVPVTKNEDGTYSISFNVPQSAGKVTLEITNAILENEGEVETYYASNFEVLKDIKPTVEGISIVDQEGNNATLAFTIKDEENTFVKGRIVITNSTSGEKVEKIFNTVEDTVHELNNIKDFENYNVEIYITYDLDLDKENVDNQSEELFAQKEFELIGNYDFNFSNLKVRDINRENNVVILEFKATLTDAASDTYFVDTVMVNGVECKANLEGNNIYTVEVPFTDIDRKELVVQEAILNNSQGFKITENNSVVVFKTAPTAIVSSTVLRELTDGLKTITASLEIKDEDRTIKEGSLYANLVDSEGNIIDTKPLTGEETEIAFTSEKVYTAGTYTIDVYADYNLEDGLDYEDKVIGSGKVSVVIYAKINDAQISKYYVNKGEKINITYDISSNTDKAPTGIIINDEILTPIKNEDGTYTVEVTAPEKYGKFVFNTTRLVYGDEQQTSATSTLEVDVLKDVIPTVSEISVDSTNVEKPVLSFKVLDEEDTFVSGKIVITDTQGNEVKEIVFDSKENNNIVLDGIEEFTEYNLKIELTYDLDSNKENEDNQTTKEVASSKLYIMSDYEFTLENFRLNKVDTTRNVIVLNFESENKSNYEISNVYINGTEYKVVSKDGTTYTVEIPYEEANRTELVLQKVALENLKEFTDLNQENIVVFKNKPISNITSVDISTNTENESDVETTTIKATFDIVDIDNVVSNVYARLLDENGEEIEVKSLEKYAKEVEFTSSEIKAGKYTVEILADYDAVDGEVHQKECIATADANISIVANIIDAKVENYYVNKNSAVKITYEIKSNTDKELQSVNINGNTVVPEKTSDEKYVVNINAPEVAGEYEYNLTELVYSEETVSVSNVTKVDVLKSTKPVIDAISVVDQAEKNATLAYTIADEENTFVKGRIVVTHKDVNGNVLEEVLNKEFTSINEAVHELSGIEDFESYNVKIYITYDLDSDKNDTANQKEELFAEKDFELVGDFEFNFSELKVKNVDRDREVVELEFKTTLAEAATDTYYIESVVINGEKYIAKLGENRTYTVEVPFTNMNRQELVVQEAILNNSQGFKITENNSVVIFKSVGGIVIATVADDLKSIKADVTINDEDNIANNVCVRLLNSQNEVIAHEDNVSLSSNKATVTFENGGNYYKAGEYTVEVIASYDAVDGLTHDNEVIVSTKTEVKTGAIIDSSKSDEYAQKGQEIEIEYALRTNTDSKVSTIVVNNIPCDASLVEGTTNTYKVKVKVPENAGVADLKVTRVNFEDGNSANVEYTSQIEVLKSTKPTIDNLSVNDSQDNPILSFNIADEENTFVKGRIVVTDKAGIQVDEKIFTSKESTSFVIENTEDFKEYYIDIYITYDLDEDKADERNQATDKLVNQSVFSVIGEYNFTLDNLKVTNINRDNKIATLEFDSTNASETNENYTNYYVQEVTINGTIYQVSEISEQKYSVDVSYVENDTREELVLQSAKLNNLKEFTDLNKSVVIFKNAPTMEVNASVNDKLDVITADIKLTDIDGTLLDLNAKLINPKGETLYTKEIDNIGNNETSSVSFQSIETDGFKAGEYTVQIGADYELVDGLIHNTKDQIGTGTVKVSTIASIVDAQVENYYVKKGENVNVKYTLKSNNENGLTGVNIENAFYEAVLNEDKTYTVSIPAVSTGYGVNKHSVTVAVFGSETVKLDETRDAEYYVLKDEPTIDSYTFNKYTTDPTLTFNFNNNEKALLDNAVLVVKNSEGTEVLTHELVNGENVVELKSLVNDKYTVGLKGTYDLDDNLDDKNSYELSRIFEENEIDVISNYNLELNVKNVTVDKEAKQVVVTFESSNAANYQTKYVTVNGNEYEATLNDGVYTVKIPYDTEDNKEFSITKVKVENDIELELSEAKTFEIFKAVPNAKINTSISDNNKTITATFELSDEDNTVKVLYARLLDKDGNVVKEQQLDTSARSVDFTQDNDEMYKASDYTIQIGADYDRVDGESHNTKETIGSQKLTVGVKANIVSSNTVEFAKKKEDIKVTYKIISNTDKDLKYIVVNGRKLPVTNTSADEYEVTYTTRSQYGEEELSVENIVYSDDINVAVEKNAANVYVLKDAPSITEYSFNYIDNPATITFEYNDIDKAQVDEAKVIILDKDTNAKIKEQAIQTGKNTIELTGLENDTYLFKIEGKYDLDEDKSVGTNEHDISEIFDTKEIAFIGDYELEFNIKSVDVDRENNQSKVLIESSNAGNYPVSFVVIDGKRYPVVEEEGKSYALVPYTTEDNQVFTISEVVLSNGVELILNESKSFEIFKDAPTITGLEANTIGNDITVKYQIIDEENIMENSKVLLVNSKGETIQQIDIDRNSSTVTFEDVENAGHYTVKIVADYDRVDGENHIQETLSETTAKVAIIANIEKDSKQEYANKNSEIEIIYTINSNTDEKVVNMTINGNVYSVEEIEGTYKVKYTTSQNAGDEELKVTELEYANGDKVTVEYNSSIEVLKDKLSIENFKVDTNLPEPIASFTMIDDDESFENGKIIVTNTKENSVEEIELEKGQNEYTLNLKEFGLYTIELQITYDLDKDYSNNVNNNTESFGKLENIEYIKDYKLNISDLEVLSVDIATRYSAQLQFKSTNSSIYDIYSVTIDDKAYEVQKVEGTEDTYTFEYAFFEEGKDQRKEINITGVTLTNNANIQVEDKVSTVIFKEYPIINNIELSNIDNQKIKVSFNVTDNDVTLEDITVLLKNDQDETITENKLSPDARETEFEVISSGKYKVEIDGTFDRVDGVEHVNEYIAESENIVEILPKAQVTTDSISNQYPAKGETIEIKYNIKSNTMSIPTKVVLNDTMEYSLTYEEETGLYKINYIAPADSTVLNLQVTKVYFENDIAVENNKDSEDKNLDSGIDIIEVLKAKPTVDITSTDMLEQNKVLFNIKINDTDSAMTSAKAKFHDKEYVLEKGPNAIYVDVVPDQEHTITVEVEYDLDYNNITIGTDRNDNTGTVTESKNFKLVSDYGFEITDMDVFNPNNNEKSMYFDKNANVQLRFNARNNTSLEPDKVIINDLKNPTSDGVEYQVNKFEDNTNGYDYYVELNAKGTAGTQEFKVTSVKLSSSNIIPESKFVGENPIAKIDVLKTKPTMINYTSSNEENVLTVMFNVTDDDDALTKDSSLKVIDTTNNSVFKAVTIHKGENTHKIENLVPGVKYSVIVENDYVLSEDGQIKATEKFNEEQIEITKKEESNFKVKNLTISKRVPINTDVHISFENGVMSYENVDTVIIDGQSYPVTKGEDNIYRLDIEPKEIGLNSIDFDSVKIGEKSFVVGRNLSYIYEKSVPTAIDVSEINENTSTNEAVITYKLVDEDSSVKSLTAYMKNSSGSIAATKKINLEDIQTDENGISTVTMPLLKMNTYSIELKATCDIGDGKTIEEKSLFEKQKYTAPRVTVMEQSIDKEYVNKGEVVVLTYKINTNVNQEVKKIYIGDESYNVKKVTDKDGKIVEDTYTIEVKAPKTSGVFEQEVTRVQIGPNLIEADYPENTQLVPIKVLKDIPTLTHFIVDEQKGVVTFKVNDPDEALVKPNPVFVVKDAQDTEVYNGTLTNGGADYSFNLRNINVTNIGDIYNVAVDVTYDQRPDAPQDMNIFQKVANIFSNDDVSTIAEEVPEDGEETEPEVNYVITDNIFNEDIKLTGNIKYDLKFEQSEGYMFSLKFEQPFFFDCSTGTDYKVSKVIIDGEEYPVEVYKEKDDGKTISYQGSYKAKHYLQDSITFEKVILDNGAALDIENGWTFCMVQQNDPTFDVTDFIEDVKEGTVTFNYKLTDDDMKLYSDLTFTLMDSQNKTIDTKVLDRNANSVEFKIPNPPTSVYRLKVTAQTYEFPGWDGWLNTWTAHDEQYQSSVNTSILSSSISNKYPKKGETITIDYGISSTKVVLIDKEDHSNQDKAVSITALTIDGKDYDVEALEQKEQYRIYYTAPTEDGVKDLQVTHIKFSNGDVEEFVRNDQIEVLKDAPQVQNFKTENKVDDGKIEFSFDILDEDNVLSTNSIYAKLGEQTQQLTAGHNDVEFTARLDEFEKFEIKATYDLDTNTLQNEDTTTDDNYYEDYTIFEKQVLLTGDYGISFSNIHTINTKGEDTKYIDKNEETKVVFDCVTKFKELYPEKIVVDGNEYTLEKVPDTENTYTITLPGKDTAGEISSKIESVTLNSGNEVTIQNQNIAYEILKDPVKVTNFTHYIAENADKVNLTIDLEDKDLANKNTRIEIQDEYGSKVTPSADTLSIGTNNISFTKTEGEKYFVSVYSTYNTDIDDSDTINYNNDVRILYQIVSLTTRHIEMKDIVDIKLYILNEYDIAQRVDTLSEDIANDLAGNKENLDNYLVEVSMKNISTFYSKITKATLTDNKLKLELAYDDAMVYTDDGELRPLEVTLDVLEGSNEYEYKGSFKALLDKMRMHPTEDITLDKDYDLKEYQVPANQKAIIDFEFKGKINGNGHTISNLIKPLFNKLNGATVENLVIKGIVFNGNDAKGPIAITATNNTTISNVHVENIVSSGSSTAGLVYELTNNSVIEKSSATNIAFNIGYTVQNVSGGVVSMKNNSKIDNCYLQGFNTSGWWRNAGLAVLSDNTSIISNNIVNMRVTGSFNLTDDAYGHGNGGIVSHAQNPANTNNHVILKNNLSLVEGNGAVGAIYNYKGSSLSPDSVNNYQLDTAAVKNDEKDGVVTTISKDSLNAEFFKKKLGLDENIWNISDDTSIDNLPVLKGVSASFSDGGKQPTNTEVYIPDYNRVSSLETYDENREIAYHNMYKLMPFYDAKEIIRDGNKIPVDNDLYTKVIRYIVPFNKEGKMISNLTTDNYNSLDKIHIVFEDGTKLTYNIVFDDYYGNVASYIIADLNIGYNYNNYVIDTNQDIIQRLVDEASSYEFRRDLDPLTAGIEEDSRLYEEHYNNYTKYHIKEFVINLLVNMGYSPNNDSSSDILNKLIEQELIGDDIAGPSIKLKQLLFAYNYFTYWYNLDMDGINLADSTMFHSNEMFDKDMTMEYLAEQLVQGTNSATNGIAGFYNNYFVKYTKLSNLGYYLNYYVTTLTHYDKGIDWFKANFKGGYYYDVNVDNANDLYYTIWDHLLKDGKVQNNFLPLMTVPENSMYVMSSPSQAYFGSLRVYMTDPNDPTQRAAFEKKVEEWLREIKAFYTFGYNYWGATNINKYCDTNYDMRTTYTGVGKSTVYNNPLTTEEPYHKYFAEAIGRWPAMHGGAYANGNEVFWAVIKMLDNFRVGTHETLHNQDSKIFLNGYGRRGGAEDYAAGFIQQYYRDGWVSPNIFDEEEDLANPVFKDNTTQNLRKSSVENDDKLHAYYDKYFRVNDFLDWVEAQAYFELSDAQKANISVKVSYPEVQDQEAGDDVVAYTPLTEDAVAAMKLDDMADLWDNKIMLRPGVKDYERRSPGADTDSIFNIHWYQPHADNDRPDGANFKYIAWQMAGEGGYYEGFVPYYSLSYIGIKNKTGEKTTDLTALRYIMNNPDITFRQYKLDRYEKLSKYYNLEGTYVDGQQIYKEYLEALKTDADNKDRGLSRSTAVKRKYFKQIRLETNDFNIEPFEAKAEVASMNTLEPLDQDIVVTNAEELVSKITENPNANIILGNNIDLSNYVDGEAVINTEFSGTLNGNNYIISGSRIPIFNSIKSATVENINIKNAVISINSNNVGVLSKTITNSTITNVVVENSTVNAKDNVGSIAGIVDNSQIKNVHAKSIEITANTKVGGLVGSVINNSTIQQSSVNAKVNSNNTEIGTFIGKIENSQINNSYALGRIVNKSTNEKLSIGGFVGYADSSTLQNNFVKVDMDTPENAGGFIGEAVNTINITNNLSLSEMINKGYKFDGRTDDKKLFSTDKNDIYANNYELTNTKGKMTTDRNENIRSFIIPIEFTNITDSFYINTLKYSIDIWDLSQVNNGGLPRLRNSDPNKEQNIINNEQEEPKQEDRTFKDDNSAIEEDKKDKEVIVTIPDNLKIS